MEMRELNGQDTFLLLPIISKIGLKELIEEYNSNNIEALGENATDEEREAHFQKVGMNFMATILETMLPNLAKAQDDINKLLASVCDTTQKEIKELDFATYNMLVVELFTQEAFTSFFKQLFSSIK